MNQYKGLKYLVLLGLVICICTGCYSTKRDSLSVGYSDKKVEKLVKEYIQDKYGSNTEVEVKSVNKYTSNHTIIDSTTSSIFRGFVADCGEYLVFMDFPEEYETIQPYTKDKYIMYDTKQTEEINEEIQRMFSGAVPDIDGYVGLHLVKHVKYEVNDIKFWQAFNTKFDGDVVELFKNEYSRLGRKGSLIAILGNCGSKGLNEINTKIHDNFLMDNTTIICYVTDSNAEDIKDAVKNCGGYETDSVKSFLYPKFNDKYIDILNISKEDK